MYFTISTIQWDVKWVRRHRYRKLLETILKNGNCFVVPDIVRERIPETSSVDRKGRGIAAGFVEWEFRVFLSGRFKISTLNHRDIMYYTLVHYISTLLILDLMIILIHTANHFSVQKNLKLFIIRIHQKCTVHLVRCCKRYVQANIIEKRYYEWHKDALCGGFVKINRVVDAISAK